MSPNPLLDVESPESRQERLGRLLAAQDSPLSSPERPSGPPTTFRVEPPSELLSRLQAFLPQIASANEALASRAPEDVDIENVGEGESQYVEMDLGLGVYNALMDSAGRDAAGRDAAPPDSESGSEGSDSSSSDESSSEEESSSSEEESDEPKGEGLNEENSAVGERASIPKAQKRVLIEEIKETKSESQ